MNGISSGNEEMRNAQKNCGRKDFKGGDLVEVLDLGVGVTSQRNSAELGEDME